MTENAAFLARLLAEPRNWATIANEVEESGTALSRFRTTGQQSLFDSSPAVDLDFAQSEDLLRQWSDEGMSFASLLHEDYPPQLLTILQRPPFVMWRGQQNSKDASGVCIIGSRAASPRGMSIARRLAADLSASGVTIISGLAEGIDTAAHTGALECGGRTVAVIGTGLRRAYPAKNAKLQEHIAAEGMVLSQFLPDSPPTRFSFPMRNAVMSGYGAATVVVEASWKSGAKMQARLALEHGRIVFLWKSLLEHDWARAYAERPGAHVVESADDVLEGLQSSDLSEVHLSWS